MKLKRFFFLVVFFIPISAFLSKAWGDDSNPGKRLVLDWLKTQNSSWKRLSDLEIEPQFKTQYGMNADEFVRISNQQMKEGISTSASRFSETSAGRTLSPIFLTYLSTNLEVLKSGDALKTENINRHMWKRDSSQIGLNESIGGNAGPGALAINFLYDNQGRILFVGNIQDCPPHVRKEELNKNLRTGTVRTDYLNNFWELYDSESVKPEIKKPLIEGIEKAIGRPPIESSAEFARQCKMTLQRLIKGK